jgi:O-antigen/teichoic acid export membrane protein
VERPDVNFKANLLGLATAVALCVWLLGIWGVLGAACGLLAGDLVAAALRWAVFLRLVADTPREVTNASTGG